MSNGPQSNSFRLASDQDYRRGVILGLTLAEVLLLLIFLLLLAAGALIARAERRAESALVRAAMLERDIAPLLTELERQGHPHATADELAAIIRRSHEADALESELSTARAREVEAKRENEAIHRDLAAARLERDGLRNELNNSRQALAAMLADNNKIADYRTALRALDAIPGGLGEHPDQTITNMLGQYKQAMQELSRLKGNGSGFPFCWVTPVGQPVYMLTFELHDGGFVVHEEAPRPRPEDPAWLLLRDLPRETQFSESNLPGMVAPLMADATHRQCRYAVDVIDRTNNTNKSGYRHLNYVLDQSFARREINK